MVPVPAGEEDLLLLPTGGADVGIDAEPAKKSRSVMSIVNAMTGLGKTKVPRSVWVLRSQIWSLFESGYREEEERSHFSRSIHRSREQSTSWEGAKTNDKVCHCECMFREGTPRRR